MTSRQIPSCRLVGPGELAQVEAAFRGWTNIVVGDYCLPYRLSSHNLYASSSGSRLDVPPIVLLEQTLFCADDETLYEFLLYPLNGQLKGEGSFFANGKYYFQPTLVSPDLQHDVAIAFTYSVDGYENSLVILISPKPETRFFIGKTDRSDFCVVDKDVALIPLVGRGTFTAWEGEEDISSQGEGVIQNNRLFRPSQVDLDGANEKTITLRHRISNDQGTCTGVTNRTIRVHAQPLVNFRFGENDNSSNDEAFRVCANVANINLIGTPTNGVFRVLEDNHDISRRMLRGDRLLPSAFNLAGSDDKILKVEYSVVDKDGCINEITKDLTILALPDAEFQVGDENQTMILQDSHPIPLVTNTPGGDFTATIEGIDVSDQVLDKADTATRFLPTNVVTDREQAVQLVYRVNDANGCNQRSRQTLTVVVPPDPIFQVGEPGQTEFSLDDSPAPLIPKLLGGQFSAFDDEQDITAEVIQPQRRRFIPANVDLGASAFKSIRLLHEITRRGFTRTSNLTVTVHQISDESDDRDTPADPNSPNTPPPSPAGGPSTDSSREDILRDNPTLIREEDDLRPATEASIRLDSPQPTRLQEEITSLSKSDPKLRRIAPFTVPVSSESHTAECPSGEDSSEHSDEPNNRWDAQAALSQTALLNSLPLKPYPLQPI